MSTYAAAAGTRATFAIGLFTTGPKVDDGDGGYTEPLLPLWPKPVCGSIRPVEHKATGPADLEHVAADTTLTRASSVVVLPFVPGVTTATVLQWTDRHGTLHTATVVGVTNLDGRDAELELFVVEATR